MSDKFAARIADLIWLCVVITLALGWWVDRSKLASDAFMLEYAVRSNRSLPRDSPFSFDPFLVAVIVALVLGWGLDHWRQVNRLPASQAPAPNQPKD